MDNAHLKVKQKIDSCRTAIITWSKKQREVINKQLETLKSSIERETVATQPDVERLANLKLKLVEVYKAEEA